MISGVGRTDFIIVVAFAVGALAGGYVNVRCINTISQIQLCYDYSFKSSIDASSPSSIE